MATLAATKASAGLTAAGVDIKWSMAAWAKTEVRLNDFDLLVLKNLVCAAKSKNDESTAYNVMGDYLYQAVRPALNTDNMKLLDATDSRASTPSIGASVKTGKNRKGGRKGGGGGGNKAKKGPSKADQIRMQNSVGTLNSKIQLALNAFYEGGDTFQRPKLFLDKIVEMRGIGFLCCSWFLLSKRKRLEWDKSLTVLTYSIIVSLERFIKTTTNLKGKSHLDSLKEGLVSPTLLFDLNEKLQELKDKFKFSGEQLYTSAPQLLIFSEFDTALPVSSVKPYPHQTRICEILEQNLDNGCYVMYRAVTNAGKTTTIAMLAATIQKIRSQKDEKDILSKLQIIFCCGANPVKNQAGQWLFNSSNINAIDQLPFAIAFDRPPTVPGEPGELVIRNNWMCRARPDDRLVIVCSPKIAVRILKERAGMIPFILFHDEPTIGAEDVDNDQIYSNVELLTRPPKWTIVSSATLPSEEELGPFLRRYKNKFTNGHIENVSSATINIGCDVYSHGGDTFMPHLGCSSVTGLTKCVANIESNMFLSRTYTPLSVSELCTYSQEHGCPNIPKINEHFSSIDNLSADAVRQFGLNILQEVAQTDDKTAKSICSQRISCNGRSVEFSKLGTSGASKFSQMSLIASSCPLEFALENFTDLLDEIKEGKIHTIEKLVAQYWKVQEQWSNDIEKLRKRKTKPPAKSKRRNSRGEVEEEEEVDYGQQEMDLLANKPYVRFPEYYQINTRMHAEKYAPNGKVDVERFQLPDFSFLTSEKQSMNVSNDVLLLLCCGVGIYAPQDMRVKSDTYLQLVIELSQKGRLAYLVSDHNIAYGVNFPFSRTIVCNDFTAAHSMNTVFQLMSRAGRVGQSWFAESFVSDEVVSTMRDYAHSNTSPDRQMEIKNMITVAKNIAQREREKKQAREGI